MNEFKLSGGVFIIGSLLWDNSEKRKIWRNKNLNLENSLSIDLPIRYGRISTSRNCTYTMVYSSECKSKPKLGKGFFIPFSNNPVSINVLFSQASNLIEAEHDREIDFKRFNWGWGTLGLTLNPKLLEDLERKEDVKKLLPKWKEKYSEGFEPNDYKTKNEKPIISKEGLLDINWPNELEEFDFAIGTACKPEAKKYPTARKIALRMLVNEYDKYFRKNLEHSIATYQDEEIKLELDNNDELAL